MADNTDVKKMTFERAIEELEAIVKRLEEGKVPLEESVTIYERGEALKRRCEELLTPGRGAGREDHARRVGQAERHRAAGCEVARRARSVLARSSQRRMAGLVPAVPT